MILNVLAVGDVVGESGVDYLNRHLRSLKKLHEVHFTVVNGENASGVGILPRQARDIFDAGADVITLGNHTWNRIRSPTFWRTTNIPCGLPTTPTGCQAGAGECTTVPGACGSA